MNYFPTELMVKMLQGGCFGEISEKDVAEFKRNLEFYPQKSMDQKQLLNLIHKTSNLTATQEK